MTCTVVSFHAHPDDEALLTAGTLARAAADGHRVVLVSATDGGEGLAGEQFGTGSRLAQVRRDELQASAEAIGAARVVFLGYADSGLHGTAEGNTLVRADQAKAARQLVDILDEERADVLTGYDRNGGYGHPDHVAVHHIARRAAELFPTARLLEATIDRDLLVRALTWGRRLRVVPAAVGPDAFAQAYAARREITHVVDVREAMTAKLAALRAHASQATGEDPDAGSDRRTVGLLSRLPGPLARAVLGREWFIDPAGPQDGAPPGLLTRMRH